MGDVLEFPSRQAQALAYLDREVRQLLLDRGADQVLVDFAAGQLTEIYSQLAETEQYQFSLELPATVSEQDRDSLEEQINLGLEAVRRENHGLMVQLVAQLVLAELRLFQLQRPEETD